MSTSTNNPNPNTTTLNAVTVRENLNYIENFELPLSVAQYIDIHLIFHDVHIDNLTIMSNIEFNLWLLNCLKNYQLRSALIIYRMLDVFHNKFHRWEYMEFSKLDWYIRGILKKTFMAKKIYIDTPNGYIN